MQDAGSQLCEFLQELLSIFRMKWAVCGEEGRVEHSYHPVHMLQRGRVYIRVKSARVRSVA